MASIVAGSNVTVNNTDPANPIVSATVPVTSVNGATGAVVLGNTDVGAAATSHSHATSDVTGLDAALAGKAAAQAN